MAWFGLVLVWFGSVFSVQTLLLGMVNMCAKFEGSSVRAKVWPGLVWFGLVLVWFGLVFSVQTLLLGMVNMCAKFEGSSVRAKVWPGLVWFGSGLVWFVSANIIYIYE